YGSLLSKTFAGFVAEEFVSGLKGVIDTGAPTRWRDAAVRVSRRWMWPVVLAIAPWLWFAVRLFGPNVDLAAVLLPAAAVTAMVVCALIAILGRRPSYAVPIASLAMFTAVAIVLPRTPHATADPIDPFVFISANVFIHNSTPVAAARSLADRHPDVLVAVEATQDVQNSLAASLHGYAH